MAWLCFKIELIILQSMAQSSVNIMLVACSGSSGGRDSVSSLGGTIPSISALVVAFVPWDNALHAQVHVHEMFWCRTHMQQLCYTEMQFCSKSGGKKLVRSAAVLVSIECCETRTITTPESETCPQLPHSHGAKVYFGST